MNSLERISSPAISVLMSVHDEGKWVSQAIESILSQTYSDLEFIITDDGSVDNTYDILRRHHDLDDRIRIVRHTKCFGLAASLNEQIKLARGDFIARMDGDDIAREDRFAKQVNFMNKNPGVGLLGSFCKEIDLEGREICLWRRPVNDPSLQRALLRFNPFIHSSVMLRREVFSIVGQYNPTCAYAQDYELWLRVAGHYSLANLPEPLMCLRVDWNKLARKNREARQWELRILARHIRAGAYPVWYYSCLFRPYLLSLLPTGWIMKLKSLQRRQRSVLRSTSELSKIS